jgi:hypothetical protein
MHTMKILSILLATAAVSNAQWGGVPEVSSVLPSDATMSGQAEFNNLAWQEFIALNWLADPKNHGEPDPNAGPETFGTPNNPAPVVWETYKESSEVFQANAKKPSPWNDQRQLPEIFTAMHGKINLAATSTFGVKGLGAASKFATGPHLDLSDFGEAFTGGAWLTAQPMFGNHITLFEKRINRDEFEYIRHNQLYNADVQQTFPGIILPDGSGKFSQYGKVGAIETKAAWIQIDDEKLWPLYKTSKAWVSYPTEEGTPTPPKLVTVGLVGLHIIHKTQKAQQFVWATFEHVRNAPSTADIAKSELKDWYTYYDPKCDSAACPPNQKPDTEGPNKTPYNKPTQVVRTQPISSTTTNNIQNLNNQVWDTIRGANPDSVFLNYQLVNVLWPNVNSPIENGAQAPLPDGSPQPPNQKVANTTLETYHQTMSCMQCHQSATIAPAETKNPVLKIFGIPQPTLSNSNKASDYSFLFFSAQSFK